MHLRYRYSEQHPNSYIANLPDYALSPTEPRIREAWASLPLELAILFTSLDKYVTEDIFYVPLRGKCVVRLDKAGFVRIGDLIGHSKEEVAERAQLSPRELHIVERILTKLGLSFGMDVTRWQTYRETMPATLSLRVPHGITLPQDRRSAFEL